MQKHHINVVRKKNPEPRNESKVAELIGDASGAIVTAADRISSIVFEKCTNLKIIVIHGVGFDQMDMAGAEQNGIKVCLCPGNHESVADLTWSLIHASARTIGHAIDDVKKGIWMPQGYGGYEVCDKTLGIIGYGRIGKAVARRSIGYRCQVLVYDPFIEKVTPENDLNLKKVDQLEEIYEKADIISLHMPATKESYQLLNREAFRQMKDGVLIINTARGDLIAEDALLEALESRKVHAAGLDVIVDEPPQPNDNKLLNHPRVIVTPHMAAHTIEANFKTGMVAANAIVDALVH